MYLGIEVMNNKAYGLKELALSCAYTGYLNAFEIHGERKYWWVTESSDCMIDDGS